MVTGCNNANHYVPPPPPSVTVVQPLQQPITRYFELTGNTVPLATVDLEARVQGFLEAITYKDGATVTKGAPLFTIQRDTYEAHLRQAKGNLAAQQAGQANAQSEYQRQAALNRDEFASLAILEQSKTKLDQANAAVAEAQANLDLASINLGYTTVLAPFDGIVTNHLMDVGALVGVGGPTKLAQIVGVVPIYVYFNGSERQALLIMQALAKQGRTLNELSNIPVEVGLQSEVGYPHVGKLDYVSPQVDPSTGTLLARAVLDNADRSLIPGLFVRVRVAVGRQENALLVREEAISVSQQGSYVLVVDQDDKVAQRIVTTGQSEGRYRVIEAGLTSSDWVVTDGIQRAVPGAKVSPRKVVQESATASKPSPGTPAQH